VTDRRLSIVVPAYNETGNLQAAIQGVLTAADATGEAFEIIVVNDGSTDGTGECAEYLATMIPEITVIHHPENRGLRAAYESGVAVAQYPYLTWVPGDGEIATESLTDIFSKTGQADLTIPYHGTPEKRPWFRRLLTWVSTNEINWLFGQRLHYWQGPVVYPTAFARALPRTVPGFFCMAEQLITAMEANPTYIEVPLTHQERTYGVSKAVSPERIWDAQMAVLRFWWRLRVRRQPVPTIAAPVGA
jgi:glycosyltransferase involved in cell wall biosynthesis